jgi:hypothetical protein
MVRELVEKPNQITTYVFDMMAKQGLIRETDTRVLAEEYNAYIVYLYFEQNFLYGSPNLDVIDKKMKQHNEFFSRYVLKQGE